MANYECRLTAIGSFLSLWRFDRVIRRVMVQAEKQYPIPFQNALEYPKYFRSTCEKPHVKQYSFITSFLPTEYVRHLSDRFASLVINMTFDIDCDVWDEGFQQHDSVKSGDFTFIGGETACGYFIFENVERYPAWDYDPEPLNRDNKTKETSNAKG